MELFFDVLVVLVVLIALIALIALIVSVALIVFVVVVIVVAIAVDDAVAIAVAIVAGVVAADVKAFNHSSFRMNHLGTYGENPCISCRGFSLLIRHKRQITIHRIEVEMENTLLELCKGYR